MNFNRLFLKLNQFICSYLPLLPDHWLGSLSQEDRSQLLES